MTAKQRAIKERLRELEDHNNGTLTPEVVVEDAKNPSSVLHDYFEWDDHKAAKEYRLDQARELIRSVRYVETTTQVELQAPNYLAVTLPTNEHVYMTVDKIKASKDLARDAMNEEIKRARSALERARAVADVLELSGELEKAIEWVVNLQKAAA